MAGKEVSFWCNATTDPAELTHLKIEWMKNDELLTTAESNQWSILDGGRRLNIKHIAVEDSGRYTCTASNGLDSDSVSVALTVKGKLCILFMYCVNSVKLSLRCDTRSCSEGLNPQSFGY